MSDVNGTRLIELASWVEGIGPQGGHFWYNEDTGEKRYTLKKPVSGGRIPGSGYHQGFRSQGKGVPQQDHLTVADEEGAMSGQEMAQWYAELYNAMESAGVKVDKDEIMTAFSELHGTGWLLHHTREKGWEAIHGQEHAQKYESQQEEENKTELSLGYELADGLEVGGGDTLRTPATEKIQEKAAAQAQKEPAQTPSYPGLGQSLQNQWVPAGQSYRSGTPRWFGIGPNGRPTYRYQRSRPGTSPQSMLKGMKEALLPYVAGNASTDQSRQQVDKDPTHHLWQHVAREASSHLDKVAKPGLVQWDDKADAHKGGIHWKNRALRTLKRLAQHHREEYSDTSEHPNLESIRASHREATARHQKELRQKYNEKWKNRTPPEQGKLMRSIEDNLGPTLRRYDREGDKTQQTAQKFWRAIKGHHARYGEEDKTLHRLSELYEKANNAFRKALDTGKDESELRGKINMIHHALHLRGQDQEDLEARAKGQRKERSVKPGKDFYEDLHGHLISAGLDPDKARSYIEKEKQKAPEDRIPGGLADKARPEEFDPEAVSKGAKVESEHTKDPAVAEEIARDHLKEDPEYYEKLEKVEKPPESPRTPPEEEKAPEPPPEANEPPAQAQEPRKALLEDLEKEFLGEGGLLEVKPNKEGAEKLLEALGRLHGHWKAGNIDEEDWKRLSKSYRTGPNQNFNWLEKKAGKPFQSAPQEKIESGNVSANEEKDAEGLEGDEPPYANIFLRALQEEPRSLEALKAELIEGKDYENAQEEIAAQKSFERSMDWLKKSGHIQERDGILTPTQKGIDRMRMTYARDPKTKEPVEPDPGESGVGEMDTKKQPAIKERQKSPIEMKRDRDAKEAQAREKERQFRESLEAEHNQKAEAWLKKKGAVWDENEPATMATAATDAVENHLQENSTDWKSAMVEYNKIPRALRYQAASWLLKTYPKEARENRDKILDRVDKGGQSTTMPGAMGLEEKFPEMPPEVLNENPGEGWKLSQSDRNQIIYHMTIPSTLTDHKGRDVEYKVPSWVWRHGKEAVAQIVDAHPEIMARISAMSDPFGTYSHSMLPALEAVDLLRMGYENNDPSIAKKLTNEIDRWIQIGWQQSIENMRLEDLQKGLRVLREKPDRALWTAKDKVAFFEIARSVKSAIHKAVDRFKQAYWHSFYKVIAPNLNEKQSMALVAKNNRQAGKSYIHDMKLPKGGKRLAPPMIGGKVVFQGHALKEKEGKAGEFIRQDEGDRHILAVGWVRDFEDAGDHYVLKVEINPNSSGEVTREEEEAYQRGREFSVFRDPDLIPEADTKSGTGIRAFAAFWAGYGDDYFQRPWGEGIGSHKTDFPQGPVEPGEVMLTSEQIKDMSRSPMDHVHDYLLSDYESRKRDSSPNLYVLYERSVERLPEVRKLVEEAIPRHYEEYNQLTKQVDGINEELKEKLQKVPEDTDEAYILQNDYYMRKHPLLLRLSEIKDEVFKALAVDDEHHKFTHGKLDYWNYYNRAPEAYTQAESAKLLVNRAIGKLMSAKVPFKGDDDWAHTHTPFNTKEVRFKNTISASELVHELGHVIENNQPHILAMSLMFLWNRIKDGKAVSLAEHGIGSGIGVEDDFGKVAPVNKGGVPAYIGKVYMEDLMWTGTEILSKGMEMLYNDPVGFAQADPEYFSLVVNSLRSIHDTRGDRDAWEDEAERHSRDPLPAEPIEIDPEDFFGDPGSELPKDIPGQMDETRPEGPVIITEESYKDLARSPYQHLSQSDLPALRYVSESDLSIGQARYEESIRKASDIHKDLLFEYRGEHRKAFEQTRKAQEEYHKGMDILGKKALTEKEYELAHNRLKLRRMRAMWLVKAPLESIAEKALEKLRVLGGSAIFHGVTGSAAMEAQDAQKALAGLLSGNVSAKTKEWNKNYPAYIAQEETIYYPAKATIGSFVHEMGHHLESTNPHVFVASLQFLWKRIKGRKSKDLSKAMGNRNVNHQEIGVDDDFGKLQYLYPGLTPAYVGKIYKESGKWYATEILSKGLEFLIMNPVGFAAMDPEYFNHVIACLHSVQKEKP